jgi:hypothetical protein
MVATHYHAGDFHPLLFAGFYRRFRCDPNSPPDGKFKVLIKLPILGKPFSIESAPNTYVIYYDSIGSVELYKFKDYYNIWIKNESGKVIYRVAAYDLDRAKTFVDALHAMMNRR